MRNTAQLAFIATAAVAALTLGGCSSEGGDSDSGSGAVQPTVMKLALNQTEDHPSFIALEAFGESLSDATDGRWEIEVFPNSTLGDQAEYLQSVGDGVIDLAVVSAPQLENLDDDFVIFSLPKVFDSIDHQMAVLSDDDVVGDVYAALEESNNITVVGGLTQGARSVYTKDGPADTPKSLEGKKIRVQESPVFIEMINSLGGSPTPMAYSEVYTGLQSGVIDGAENNEVSYFTQKHFEVAPYYSYSRHLVGSDFVIINSDTLTEMSDEDRAAFDDAWTQTWELHTELWTAATADAVAGAEAGGATFVEVDSESYVDALTPMLKKFIVTDSQQALFDAIRASAE